MSLKNKRDLKEKEMLGPLDELDKCNNAESGDEHAMGS